MEKENKENNILQFEADDTSEMGINGKQVFFTKRINGKTTHYKAEDEEEKTRFIDLEKDKKEKQYIEINVSNIEKKQPQAKKTIVNKKRKKRKRKTRIIKLLLIVILFIGVLVFALISPIFNITNIEVSGNQKINSNEIKSLSGISEGTNIFKISSSKISKNVKENPYINKVSIKRKLPGTVQISVEERKIAYQIKVIDSFVYIDYQGYILETSAENANVLELEGLQTQQDTLLNGKRVKNDDIEDLRTIIRIMDIAKSSDISNYISKIIIQNGEYVLELQNENKTVYLGNGSEIKNKITYLKTIIESEKGKAGKIFLNGEFNNGFKPYFREENQEQ